MSTAAEQSRGIETLAWITDDEAEFWTSLSPTRKSATFNNYPTPNQSSSDVNLPDGLYFKSNNHMNTETEDRLSLLYKQGIEKQAKDVEEKAKKIPTSEIFEFDENTQLNENIPGVNMSFLDRLFHQLTRPRSPVNYSSDEEFTEIDETEITAVNNDNIDSLLNNENNLKKNTSFHHSIRSFIKELKEEKDVIRGILHQETFLNRRSRRAKLSFPTIQKKEVLASRTSI